MTEYRKSLPARQWAVRFQDGQFLCDPRHGGIRVFNLHIDAEVAMTALDQFDQGLVNATIVRVHIQEDNGSGRECVV